MRRERRRYYAVMLMLIFVCGIVLTACQGGLTGGEKGQNQEVQKEFFAMDTYMTFSLYGEKAGETLKDAEAKIRKLESEWSVTNQNSEIYQVNHSNGNPVTLSEDTAEVVRYALDMAKETGGALDPTIYPVLTAWGFTTGKNRVPKRRKSGRFWSMWATKKSYWTGRRSLFPKRWSWIWVLWGKGMPAI